MAFYSDLDYTGTLSLLQNKMSNSCNSLQFNFAFSLKETKDSFFVSFA